MSNKFNIQNHLQKYYNYNPCISGNQVRLLNVILDGSGWSGSTRWTTPSQADEDNLWFMMVTIVMTTIINKGSCPVQPKQI